MIGLVLTAKQVTALDRFFCIYDDELSYSVQMGGAGQSLQDHLAAVLHRNQ